MHSHTSPHDGSLPHAMLKEHLPSDRAFPDSYVSFWHSDGFWRIGWEAHRLLHPEINLADEYEEGAPKLTPAELAVVADILQEMKESA